MIRVHAEDATQALFLATHRIVHVRAGIDHARVHAEENQLANIGIGGHFEGQGRELFIVGRTAFDLVGHIFVVTHRIAHIHGRRKEIHHRVEQFLHALVLEGRPAEHRHDHHFQCGTAQHGVHFRRTDFLAVEILHQQRVVHLGHGFEHLGAILVRDLLEVGGNFDFLPRSTEIVLVVNAGLHGDQVDDADEGFALTDGQHDGNGVRTEARAHHIHCIVEIRTHTVHLIDESDAGHAVLVGLAPDGLGLRFDATDGAEQRDGAVQHAKGALHFHGEIDVSRRIDDIDAIIPPETGRCGAGNGDTALFFLLHPIHGCRAVMHFTHAVQHTRIEEDALRGGGFTGIDVGHDADIPRTIECIFPFGHYS